MSDNLPVVATAVPSLYNLDKRIAGATTDEEIVDLAQQCVYVKDTAGAIVNFAIGDLANKYAPVHEGGLSWAASFQNRTKEAGERASRLAELAESIGLAHGTVEKYAAVARKFQPGSRFQGVSWTVFQELAGSEDPEGMLIALLEEYPDPSFRMAREFRAARLNMRDQAASAAGLGRGGRSTYRFDDGSLDEEIVAARRREGREVVRLAEQETEAAVEVLQPYREQAARIPADYGNWIEDDLIETAEELVNAYFRLNPSPRTAAKVRTLVARILEA